MSEKKLIKEVREGFEENIVAKTIKSDIKDNPLPKELLQKMNAYWRAANYLSVGQIYLYDNPLLKQPLKLSHVKPLVVGTSIGMVKTCRKSGIGNGVIPNK
jgi:phosphoketolase